MEVTKAARENGLLNFEDTFQAIVSRSFNIRDHHVSLFKPRFFLLSLLAEPFGSRAKKRSAASLLPLNLNLKIIRRVRHRNMDVATPEI
jgi:hypothetical protein